jgi:hypothetical protein
VKPVNILKTSIIRPGTDPDWNIDVPKKMRFRTSRIWCMAYAVVNKLLSGTDCQPKSIVVATALGALEDTRIFLDGVFKDGFGSPRSFIASVHNSMAGKLALDFDIKGPNLTVCDGQNSFASALISASLLLKTDFPVVLVVLDEKVELLDTVIPHLSDTCKEYLNSEWEEAAVAYLLDDATKTGEPFASAAGPLPVYDMSPENKCADLAASFENSPILLPVSQTSDSFIKPAIIAYDMISESKKGNHAIGSYSPSAKAAAVVNICI